MTDRNLGPADLDIDPERSPEQRYRWFLASLGPWSRFRRAADAA